MDADLGGGVGHGEADDGGVFFQAAPVALVGEGFAAGDAQGGEKSPAGDEAGLSGGKADLLDGEKALVVKDVAVDQAHSSRAENCLHQAPFYRSLGESGGEACAGVPKWEELTARFSREWRGKWVEKGGSAKRSN